MKLLVISAFLVGICVISTGASFDFMAPELKAIFTKPYVTPKEITEVLVPQPLDHFDSNNLNTWYQRVYMNDDHYRLGGPAFFFFSGQITPADEPFWLLNSLATEMAQEYGGVLYAIEPRYFGVSQPTSDMSIDNLQYLTINQTLADFDNIISMLRVDLETFETTKFIAYGYGIGSTYATWLHQRYPGLFNGVLASSAQLEVIPNYYRYFPDISETLRKHAPEICFERITGGLAEAGEIIAAGDGVRIQELFNFVEPVDTTDERDVAAFYATIGGLLGQFLELRDAPMIAYICSILEEADHESDVEDLAYFVRYVASDIPLHASFDVIVESYLEESWDSTSAYLGTRQNAYFWCNEIAWFKTAVEIPVHIFTETCEEVFGIPSSEILARSEWTNSLFEIDPNLQNVYFTNGDMDPFRWTGIRYDLNENSPADVIPNVGKKFDLTPFSEGDTIKTHEVKLRAFNLVRQWIEFEI